MKLHRDLREFLQSLNAAEVRYLIVGGYAVGAHGHVRYTKDLDVWLEASAENAGKVVSALRAFGLGSLDISETEFAEPGAMFQLGYDPARIDLLTKVSGLEFGSAFRRRIDMELDGIPVAIVSREDLKINKLAAGRPRDLADIDDLGFDLVKDKK